MGNKLEYLQNINVPCFNCYYGHSCKYYANMLWLDWILKTGECPAFTYPFESLYYALLQEQQKKLQEETRIKNSKFVSPLPGVNY